MGQAGSALRSSAGKNLAAVPGGHSFAEAVFFLSLELFRLISSEHRYPSSRMHLSHPAGRMKSTGWIFLRGKTDSACHTLQSSIITHFWGICQGLFSPPVRFQGIGSPHHIMQGSPFGVRGP